MTDKLQYMGDFCGSQRTARLALFNQAPRKVIPLGFEDSCLMQCYGRGVYGHIDEYRIAIPNCKG